MTTMMACSGCSHDESVHFMFAGCCQVVGCPCLAADGLGDLCRAADHGTSCNHFVERPQPPENATALQLLEWRKGVTVTSAQRERIVRMKSEGLGRRPIARELGLHVLLVQAVIHEVFGKGPAAQPRTRPRSRDRTRALDAGITPEEWANERRPGGRAATIADVDAWVADVLAHRGS